MFTGRYEAIPASGEIVQPSTAESMTATFKADYLLPFELIPGLDKQKRQQMFDRVNALQLEAEGRGVQEGGVQQSANWIASMAGSILNPLSLATGEAAGVAVKAAAPEVAAFTGRYLPSESKAFLTKPVGELIGAPENFATKETIASLSQQGISGFAQVTGFSLPSEVARTYNPKTDSFDWRGGIKASFEDGGLGFLLMSAPYMAGTLWGKLFQREADHSKLPLPGEATPEFNVSHIDEAIEKKLLSPQEGQWFKDYLTKADTTDNLSQRAIEMLIKDGHPVDAATRQVIFKILKSEDVTNLQSGFADQLAASHLPSSMKDFLNKYISRNTVDNLSVHPTSVIDGIKGVVNFVRKRLSKAPEELIDFHKIMRRLLPENVKAENPFTQNKMYQLAKAGVRNSLTVPEHVEKKIAHEEKISRIKQRISSYQKEFNRTNKNKYLRFIERNQRKLEELKSNAPSLLSHKEEIEHLKSRLLPDGKTAPNFKTTREYRRLLDLTRVRNDARRLMHEVNLRHEYELHEAYADVLDTMTKMMRSEFGKLAKSEDVVNYMRERIQTRVPEFENLEAKDLKDDIRLSKEKLDKAYEQVKTPEGQDEAVKVFDDEIKDTKANEIKEEYEEVKAQYQEFKDNPTIFSNLIQCVLGGING